jgi:hypothetical protein
MQKTPVKVLMFFCRLNWGVIVMPSNGDFYNAYGGNTLKHGEKLSIERTLFISNDKTDISSLVHVPLRELERRFNESEKLEEAVMEQLAPLVKKWEEQAALTQLIKKAIEYQKTPAISHSSNRWLEDDNNNHIRSNAVYQMSYRIYENTKYNSETKSSEAISWNLMWDLRTQSVIGNTYYAGKKIAGQDKRFTDKAAMEKYIQGRIKAFSHLFTEESPPIPKEYANYFKVNNLLVPGYRIMDEEATVKVSEADRPKESVLERIAADKAAKLEKPNEQPARTRSKSNDMEL